MRRARASGRPVKALGLLSGGLDSTLAARMLQEQGVDVEGLHFSTGFCKVDHRRALARRSDRSRRLRNDALRAGAELRLPVDIVDVSDEFLRDVVLRPKYGYGSAMNPCIDCRIFMLRKAREIAKRRGADVVFTGEVVGQRPMSMSRKVLARIEDESGLKGRLLRPLSARHLEATAAEREGLVDRDRLGDLHGRSRRDQFRLAREMGVEEYPPPSGGCCFLADGNFARRMRDLVAHRGRDAVVLDDVILLKVGRHFRLAYDLKLVLGRDEAESRFLEARSGDRWTCQAADGRGAFGLVEGEPGPERMEGLASLAARYSRHRGSGAVDVRMRRVAEEIVLRVRPADEARARSLLV